METWLQSRLIDRETGERTRPMKVLVMGMPRTGTSSLRDALRILGMKPFHSQELMVDYKRQIPLWTEALEARFNGRCKPYGRAEFDKIIGDFDVTEDIPTTLLAEDLIRAYPEARVILTTRRVDSWVQSMSKTLFRTRRSAFYAILYRLHPIARAWFPFSQLMARTMYGGDHSPEGLGRASRRYEEHYACVRALVPPNMLLELPLGDGQEWSRLCTFLGVGVPDVPYPHANDASTYRARHEYARRELIRTVGVFGVIALAALVVVTMSLKLYQHDQKLFLQYVVLSMVLYGIKWQMQQLIDGMGDYARHKTVFEQGLNKANRSGSD